MSATLSRAAMALASTCLGERHREWARAMEIELEAAIADGHGLHFSLGCLFASWRELPACVEGRLLLARYALALGLILPVAAFLSSSALLGFPQVDLGHGMVGSAGSAVPVLNDGNRPAAPVTVTLGIFAAIAGFGAAHLLVPLAGLILALATVFAMAALHAGDREGAT